MLELLLEHGAGVDTWSWPDSSWCSTCRKTTPRTVTPLHSAAQHGRNSSVEVLLASGANIHANIHAGRMAGTQLQLPLCRACQGGKTPLHVASASGHSRVVQQLLAGGACFSCCDGSGFKPLQCAAEQGHAAVVQDLLDAGDSPACHPGTRAAIILAVASRDAATVQALVAAGAEFSWGRSGRDVDGPYGSVNNAITAAVQLGCMDVFDAFVQHLRRVPASIDNLM